MSYQDDAKALHAAEARFESFASFRRFSSATWFEGALSLAEKHVVAVAAAHVTGCEFCVENHSRAARRGGVTVETVLAASFVVSAVLALREEDTGAVPELLAGQREAGDAREVFLRERLADASLPAGLGLTVAAAAAGLRGNDELAGVFARAAQQTGVPDPRLDEAHLVARTIGAGSVYAHNAAVLRAFGEA